MSELIYAKIRKISEFLPAKIFDDGCDEGEMDNTENGLEYKKGEYDQEILQSHTVD